MWPARVVEQRPERRHRADVAATPWAERISGLRQALRSVDNELGTFVQSHFDSLSNELAQDARDAARRVDDSLAEVVAAFQARERLAEHASALASIIHRVRPGDITRTRPKVEAAVRAASDALDAGGERAPLIEHDPRQPRHGVPALEEEAWT